MYGGIPKPKLSEILLEKFMEPMRLSVYKLAQEMSSAMRIIR